MPTRNYGNWETVKRINGGGQSDVYLVRNANRVAAREKSIKTIGKLSSLSLNRETALAFADAISNLSREETPKELGALKVFKIPPEATTIPAVPLTLEENEAIQRLKNEAAALQTKRPGLPKLLDFNVGERWLVTEFFPNGTLEDDIGRYRGKPLPALRAFRSLVSAVASLHKDGYIHRDIKPANVFVRNDDELVLGDFGIVYVPEAAERLTLTNERVGPRDYMPPWADFGVRHEHVQANIDAYMLGKLLWCMVAGRLKLPREYHARPEFDLAKLFPNDQSMYQINSILGACIVEHADQCLKSAYELLGRVDESIALIERHAALVEQDRKLVLPCRVCGKGTYEPYTAQGSARIPRFDDLNRQETAIHMRVLVCNVCTHYEFFAPNFPDEAYTKGWKPWK
jgi:serine/threonine protein kinase